MLETKFTYIVDLPKILYWQFHLVNTPGTKNHEHVIAIIRSLLVFLYEVIQTIGCQNKSWYLLSKHFSCYLIRSGVGVTIPPPVNSYVTEIFDMRHSYVGIVPDNKVHGANRSAPGGPHICPMNLDIWSHITSGVAQVSQKLLWGNTCQINYRYSMKIATLYNSFHIHVIIS